MVDVNFVQVFHREYAEAVAKNFKSFLDNDLYVDLIFVCKNNKKVKAHQIVISYLSKFLYDILIDNQYDSTGKVVYICLPDVNVNVMQHIIQFIYTGRTTLDTDELKEFYEDMVLLGMPACSIKTLDEPSTSVIANSYNMEGALHQPTVTVPRLQLPDFNRTPNQSNDLESIANADRTTPETIESCHDTPAAKLVISNVYSLSESFTINEPEAETPAICEPKTEATNLIASSTFDNCEESIKKLAHHLFVQFQDLRRRSRKPNFSKKCVQEKSTSNATSRFLLNRIRGQTDSASSSGQTPRSTIRKMKLRPRLPTTRVHYNESKLIALS